MDAAANPRKYEYQIKDTPKFAVMEEGWQLVDVYPKSRNDYTIYIMVFRKELPEALSSNNGLEVQKGTLPHES